MSQPDRAIKKLATDLARLKREVVSWRGAQADFTSIENGGNFTFKDGDGNVTAIVGGQDDGSNTIRHVDGPIPPVPSGLSAHVDGPIVQVSWDGSFEDADTATYDWSHLEVIVVGPSNEQLTATINDITGASTSVAATVSGEWTVVARSVSRAEKRSLDGDAGTVEVKLVDIDGAIDAVQDSANGKNKVTYSEHAPTESDPGIFDDTWFVGQVGRPNDIVEATNMCPNPSFELAVDQVGWGSRADAGADIEVSPEWSVSGSNSLKVTGNGGHVASSAYYLIDRTASVLLPGKTYTVSATARLSAPMTGTLHADSRSIVFGTRNATSGAFSYTVSKSTPLPNVAGAARLSHTFTVPAGFYGFIRLMNGSSASSIWWDEVDVAEVVAARPYFDGDTPSGATDNESHYRWTGTPHASTSEKFLPALDIGESDNWNVIEQYRHDGNGWVKVELSHHVFSTVDLGKATVGELDGIRIMGQTVRGEQLSGDAIDGKVITGGTYRTTDGTGQWSDAGLFIAQPDGTSMVRFPTDGSPLSLTASDVQIERASIGELDVTNGAVRSGGEFTLASGVTAPASPPELSTGWATKAPLPRPPERDMDWTGLAVWNGLYVRGVNVLGAAGDSADRIEVYNPDGTVNKTISIDLNPRAGVAVIGDIVYTIGPDHSPNNTKSWCHGFDLNTGERVSRWEFTDFAGGTNKLGIGTHGANLLVAGNNLNVSRRVHLLTFNPATGEKIGDTITTNEWVAYTKDIQGVHRDGNNLYMSHREAARKFTISGTTVTYDPSGAWTNPNKNAGGMTFVDGVPIVADSGAVYKGASRSSGFDIEACFTWFSGESETTPSPTVLGRVEPREILTVSLPNRAGLKKNLYLKIDGTWRQYSLPEETTVMRYPGGLSSYKSPPTTNTFPASTPAVLKSGNGAFQVKGDGSGKWGPLTFNADGTMTSTQIPAWVPVTTFTGSASAGTSGRVPAYRVWPDGKVEWRGIVAIPDTTSRTAFITIPANARIQGSTVDEYFPSVGNSAQNVSIMVLGSALYAQPFSGNTLRWFSLNNVIYYKS
jgi:hypothetical protein